VYVNAEALAKQLDTALHTASTFINYIINHYSLTTPSTVIHSFLTCHYLAKLPSL